MFQIWFLAMIFLAAGFPAPVPEGSRAGTDLGADSERVLHRLDSEDPGLSPFLNKAYGYAIFPSVGKGAAIIGGAFGRGLLYEQGNLVGYCDITQATVGVQTAGQTYPEIISFETQAALERFEAGNFAFAADAVAVVINTGAAAKAGYTNGVVAFIESQGVLKDGATICGQSFAYQPK